MRNFIPALLAVSLTGFCLAAETPEAKALAVLSSGAELHEKARACQVLGDYGTAASVAPLAALLNDEHLSDYARSGLEAIQDPSAGKALRDALPRLEGTRLAGVVNSLGVRREKAAVGELQKLALDAKRGVAAEAIASLGMIGTTDAAKTLQKVLGDRSADLRNAAAHASLIAAEQLAREGNASAARSLLERVAKAFPKTELATVAQAQAAKVKK